MIFWIVKNSVRADLLENLIEKYALNLDIDYLPDTEIKIGKENGGGKVEVEETRE